LLDAEVNSGLGMRMPDGSAMVTTRELTFGMREEAVLE